MCTYGDCAEGDQQYDNFRDWVSHEVNVHRDTKIRRPFPGQQTSKDCDLAPESLNGSFQPQPLKQVSPNDISRQQCPICLEENPTFYHIGLHLRRFAIFALPSSVGPDEDSIQGDQGSNIANADEEYSPSSQIPSMLLDDESLHEKDKDDESHERILTYKKKDTQLSKDALLQLEQRIHQGAIDVSNNTSIYHEENKKFFPRDSTFNLSFYVRIDRLEPDFQEQSALHGTNGFWFPPTIRTGYIKKSSTLFHWKSGNMTHIETHDVSHHRLGQLYSAATVFTQWPDTPHLLVVPFNAQIRHVCQYSRGWKPLTFRYVQIENTQHIYSALSANGDRQHIATLGSSHWMPQLLPKVYDDQSRSTKQQAGLIGNIPLLIALAAFSAPTSFLSSVLTNCVRLGLWQQHQHQYPAGRKLPIAVGILI